MSMPEGTGAGDIRSAVDDVRGRVLRRRRRPYDAFAGPVGSGSGPAPRRPRPALLLVAPYAFALGFFRLVAG